MDENGEVDSYSYTDVVRQLLPTNTSTLALMTTSILLFVMLVAKRISSQRSDEVILTESNIRWYFWLVVRVCST